MGNLGIFPADHILQKKPKSIKTKKYYPRENNSFKGKVFLVISPNTYLLFKNSEDEMIDATLGNLIHICYTRLFLGLMLNVMSIVDTVLHSVFIMFYTLKVTKVLQSCCSYFGLQIYAIGLKATFIRLLLPARPDMGSFVIMWVVRSNHYWVYIKIFSVLLGEI